MTLAERRAVAWARTVINHFGVDGDDTWLIPVTQADLAEHMGWARNSGTVATYLAALGAVVRQRRGGIIFDKALLADLEACGAPPRNATRRSEEIARDLTMRLGRPSPQGTVLVAGTGAGTKAASLADMAAVVGVNRATVLRHLQRLAADGRLCRRGAAWIFPHPNGRLPLPDDNDTASWAYEVVAPVAGHVNVALGALNEARAALADAIVELPSRVSEPGAAHQIQIDFQAGLDVLHRNVTSLEEILAEADTRP